MLYEQPTRFSTALLYTGDHLAWVEDYYDVDLVIYRVYPYDYDDPCYAHFLLRDGRPPMLKIVTFRLWIMGRDMEQMLINHSVLDWQHESPPGMTELPGLPYKEALAMVKE